MGLMIEMAERDARDDTRDSVAVWIPHRDFVPEGRMDPGVPPNRESSS